MMMMMIYDDDDDVYDDNVNLLHPLQHGVDDNEGSSPTNAGAAVRHDWPRVRWVQHVDPEKEMAMIR